MTRMVNRKRDVIRLCLTSALMAPTMSAVIAVGGATPTGVVDDHPDCSQGYCPSPSSSGSNSDSVESADETCNLWLGPSPIKNMEQHGFFIIVSEFTTSFISMRKPAPQGISEDISPLRLQI